jgi:hypothetical protein
LLLSLRAAGARSSTWLKVLTSGIARGHNVEQVSETCFPSSGVFGGAERDRTVDPLLAKQVLSQLSYSPTFQGCAAGRFALLLHLRVRRSLAIHPGSIVHELDMVGLGRLELPTSPLSGVRSSQLSYRPGLAGCSSQMAVVSKARAPRGAGDQALEKVSRTQLNVRTGCAGSDHRS